MLQTALQQRSPAAALEAAEFSAQLSQPAPASSSRMALETSLSVAGSQAMLRTAQQEAPHGKWVSVSRDTTRPAQSSPPHLQAESTLACGTTFQPRMLPHVSATPITSASSSPLQYLPSGASGDWAITGGVGSIGLLTAHWVAAAGHAGCMWLLSRTANAAAATHLAQHPTACVTIHQCDISIAEDALGWARSQQLDRCNILGGLLHAGGVLRDALLAKQSVKGLREAAAGKLMGGRRLCDATGAAPIAATMLFSSTAAILGPPGQANYAAANAMLNRLSDIETASGDSSDINLGSSHQRISTALSDRPCCIIILPGEKVFHVVSRMRRENLSPRGFCHLLQNHATPRF